MDTARFVDRLTRHFATRTSRRTAIGSAVAGLALGSINPAATQEATPVRDATPADGEKPVFLFVQTFAAGRGDLNPGAGTPVANGTPTPGGGASFLLTLEGHTGQTIYFSDRPDRIVGAALTARFLEGFTFSAGNPPNAALVAEFDAGQGVVVLELIEPTYDADNGTLIYGVEALEGYEGENLTPVLAEQIAARLPAAFGPAALFIDDCADVTHCWENDYVNGVWRRLGPIPMGPIPARFNLLYACCTVTNDNWNAGMDSCDNVWPSTIGLGWDWAPYTWEVCPG